MAISKNEERLVKMVSIKSSDTILSVKIGKLIEKNKAKFIYYGDDKVHYEVCDVEYRKLK